MPRRRTPPIQPDPAVVESALAAMEAEDLRQVIREALPWLDERNHHRVVTTLIDKAAHGPSGWAPDGPSRERIAEILSFGERARRGGEADPTDVDECLREGTNAFLARDYPAAMRIFAALLPPLGGGEIYIGQEEMVDEVLGVDTSACAAQYAVATYMTSAPAKRVEAVWTAIDEVSGVGGLWEPLREMERAAVEPLPELDEFLEGWRRAVEDPSGLTMTRDWTLGRWRQEVTLRLEGVDGLARIARETKCAGDFRTWCSKLVEAGDWRAALPAYEEAADALAGKSSCRGDFLDGAALAAQELGREDLPERLERAWREAPSLLRLRCWLGTSADEKTVRERAAQALEACPPEKTRQRAFLQALVGELASAAELLAAAPGLGWSHAEHPGHLLFATFESLIGASARPGTRDPDGMFVVNPDIEELEWLTTHREGPQVPAPQLLELVELAGVQGPPSTTDRAAMLRAMRTAAEKRLAGVTEEKRRRYYAHAAQLVAACAAVDPTPATAAWVARLRKEYRRYPALRREFDRYLTKS